jgi:HPt (histidine-containing phosphotransfer) domain-containing protein
VSDSPGPGTLDHAALDTLMEMVGNDPSFLAEMIDTFLEEAPGLIADMQTAATSADVDSLRRAAHTLKSNSLTFGAVRLGDLSREIEERAARSQFGDIGDLIDLVVEEYPAVAAALEMERPES